MVICHARLKTCIMMERWNGTVAQLYIVYIYPIYPYIYYILLFYKDNRSTVPQSCKALQSAAFWVERLRKSGVTWLFHRSKKPVPAPGATVPVTGGNRSSAVPLVTVMRGALVTTCSGLVCRLRVLCPPIVRQRGRGLFQSPRRSSRARRGIFL